MKKAKLIFLIPALFSITACGLGQEVSPLQAENIADNMVVENPKNMEMRLTGTEKSDDSSYKIEYLFKKNEDKEIYGKLNVSSSKDSQNVKLELYICNNDDYGKVAYAKVYDSSSNTTQVEVITYKNNSSTFNNEINPVLDQLDEVTDQYYLDVDDLKAAVTSYNNQSNNDSNLTVKYYSKGDNNLSIQATYKSKGDSDYSTNGSVTITFDKGCLTSFNQSVKFNLGGTSYSSNYKCTIKYPSSLKITLPSGWKNYL